VTRSPGATSTSSSRRRRAALSTVRVSRLSRRPFHPPFVAVIHEHKPGRRPLEFPELCAQGCVLAFEYSHACFELSNLLLVRPHEGFAFVDIPNKRRFTPLLSSHPGEHSKKLPLAGRINLRHRALSPNENRPWIRAGLIERNAQAHGPLPQAPPGRKAMPGGTHRAGRALGGGPCARGQRQHGKAVRWGQRRSRSASSGSQQRASDHARTRRRLDDHGAEPGCLGSDRITSRPCCYSRLIRKRRAVSSHTLRVACPMEGSWRPSPSTSAS